MQFGFMWGMVPLMLVFRESTAGEVCSKEKNILYLAFVNSEKTFDRVPREIV